MLNNHSGFIGFLVGIVVTAILTVVLAILAASAGYLTLPSLGELTGIKQEVINQLLESGGRFTGQVRFLATTFFGETDNYFISPTGEAVFRSVATDDLTVTRSETIAGFNADFLDSQDGSWYLDWNNFTNNPLVVSSVEGVSNNEGDIDLIASGNITITPNDSTNTITFTVPAISQGSGSGLNADLLDSLDSTQFLRSDTSDSFTSGTLTLTSPTTLSVQGALSLPTGSVTGTFVADGTITGSDLASDIVISTTGNLTTTGSGALSIAGTSSLSTTTLGNLISTTGSFTSQVADSASAIGFNLQTSTAYSTAGAKLLSIKNNTTEELAIDKDGNLTLNGNLISTGTLQGTQLISTIGDGTPPLVVISQTQVANLNASLLGGFTAAQLAGNLYNYLTNPGFEIWQRGAGPFTANLAYTADRWIITEAGTDTVSVDREATTKKDNSLYSAKITFTLGSGAGNSRLQQRLKTDQLYGLLGRTVTFRLAVRAGAATAIRALVDIEGPTASTTYSSYHTGGSTFEDLDVTVTIPTDATDVLVGVQLAATVTAYLDNATLVLGSTAQTYYPLHPEEDMARAQRYYWKTSGVTLFPQVTGNATAGGQTWTTNILFPTPMAVVPTLTKAGTWEVSNMAQPTVDAPSVEGFRLNGTSSAAGFLYSRPDSADDILTAEANP